MKLVGAPVAELTGQLHSNTLEPIASYANTTGTKGSRGPLWLITSPLSGNLKHESPRFAALNSPRLPVTALRDNPVQTMIAHGRPWSSEGKRVHPKVLRLLRTAPYAPP